MQSRHMAIGALILGLLGIIGGLFYVGSKTTEVSAKVTAVSWTRSLEVQKLTPVEKTGWEMPEGKTVKKKQDRFHKWELEKVSEETTTVQPRKADPESIDSDTLLQRQIESSKKGNFYANIDEVPPELQKSGAFWIFKSTNVQRTKGQQRKITYSLFTPKAVNKTEYTWEENEWVFLKTEMLSGNDKTPRWPDVIQDDQTRFGERTESYTVTFSGDDGNEYKKSYGSDEEQWSKYQVGQTYVLVINGFGSLSSIK